MGWLGWTEAETLDASMPAIILAYEGRVEMFKALFGDGSQPEKGALADEPPPAPENVADKLKTAFRFMKKGGANV